MFCYVSHLCNVCLSIAIKEKLQKARAYLCFPRESFIADPIVNTRYDNIIWKLLVTVTNSYDSCAAEEYERKTIYIPKF